MSGMVPLTQDQDHVGTNGDWTPQVFADFPLTMNLWMLKFALTFVAMEAQKNEEWVQILKKIVLCGHYEKLGRNSVTRQVSYMGDENFS